MLNGEVFQLRDEVAKEAGPENVVNTKARDVAAYRRTDEHV
jgi:hypothetical protein